jgi:hypothetical protein
MTAIIEAASGASSILLAASAIYIARSLQELNMKLAVIVERVDAHERRLNKLEQD